MVFLSIDTYKKSFLNCIAVFYERGTPGRVASQSAEMTKEDLFVFHSGNYQCLLYYSILKHASFMQSLMVIIESVHN